MCLKGQGQTSKQIFHKCAKICHYWVILNSLVMNLLHFFKYVSLSHVELSPLNTNYVLEEETTNELWVNIIYIVANCLYGYMVYMNASQSYVAKK